MTRLIAFLLAMTCCAAVSAQQSFSVSFKDKSRSGIRFEYSGTETINSSGSTTVKGSFAMSFPNGTSLTLNEEFATVLKRKYSKVYQYQIELDAEGCARFGLNPGAIIVLNIMPRQSVCRYSFGVKGTGGTFTEGHGSRTP